MIVYNPTAEVIKIDRIDGAAGIIELNCHQLKNRLLNNFCYINKVFIGNSAGNIPLQG
jgi:hypothetical protein